MTVIPFPVKDDPVTLLTVAVSRVCEGHTPDDAIMATMIYLSWLLERKDRVFAHRCTALIDSWVDEN